MSDTEKPTVPATSKSFAQSPMITFVVGSEDEEFRVHADILDQNTDYFEQNIAEQLSKGIQDVRIELTAEYETPTTVGTMIGHLYGHHQDLSQFGHDELIDCYKLADDIGLETWKRSLVYWTDDKKRYNSHPSFSHLVLVRSYGLHQTELYRTICKHLFNHLVSDLPEDGEGKEQMIRNRLSIEDPHLVMDVMVVMADKLRVRSERLSEAISRGRSAWSISSTDLLNPSSSSVSSESEESVTSSSSAGEDGVD